MLKKIFFEERWELKEGWVIVAVALWVIAFIISLILALWYTIDKPRCSHTYSNMETEWSLYWGCKIELNWEYLPEDLYKAQYLQNINVLKIN